MLVINPKVINKHNITIIFLLVYMLPHTTRDKEKRVLASITTDMDTNGYVIIIFGVIIYATYLGDYILVTDISYSGC